jgi:hypothetical protein
MDAFALPLDAVPLTGVRGAAGEPPPSQSENMTKENTEEYRCVKHSLDCGEFWS